MRKNTMIAIATVLISAGAIIGFFYDYDMAAVADRLQKDPAEFVLETVFAITVFSLIAAARIPRD